MAGGSTAPTESTARLPFWLCQAALYRRGVSSWGTPGARLWPLVSELVAEGVPQVVGAKDPETAVAVSGLSVVETANSARSHLAAALWRRAGNVPAVSAGTHPAAAIDPGAIAAAGRHRLPLQAA